MPKKKDKRKLPVKIKDTITTRVILCEKCKVEHLAKDPCPKCGCVILED